MTALKFIAELRQKVNDAQVQNLAYSTSIQNSVIYALTAVIAAYQVPESLWKQMDVVVTPYTLFVSVPISSRETIDVCYAKDPEQQHIKATYTDAKDLPVHNTHTRTGISDPTTADFAVLIDSVLPLQQEAS